MRSRFWVVVALVLAVGAAVTGFAFRRHLAARWHAKRLLVAPAEERAAIVQRLVALGEPGRSAVEAIAFSSEAADPASDLARVRESVLETLWREDRGKAFLAPRTPVD